MSERCTRCGNPNNIFNYCPAGEGGEPCVGSPATGNSPSDREAATETRVTPLVSDRNAFLVELRPQDLAIVRRYRDNHPGTDITTTLWLAVVSGIAELERH